jgi:hypothetical protein
MNILKNMVNVKFTIKLYYSKIKKSTEPCFLFLFYFVIEIHHKY